MLWYACLPQNIQNCQVMEWISLFNGLMNKETMYSLSHKEEKNYAVCRQIIGTENYGVKWNKSDPERKQHMLPSKKIFGKQEEHF